MKIYEEMPLFDFGFWSGAVATASRLTEEEFSIIETCLEELYPEGLSATKINDIFWFDDDFIADCLGLASIDELYERRPNI